MSKFIFGISISRNTDWGSLTAAFASLPLVATSVVTPGTSFIMDASKKPVTDSSQ